MNDSESRNQTLPPEARRREAFERLVGLQDKGQGVAASRTATAREFDLTVEQVIAIEREGLAQDWPPLASE